jgi:hypothetical protein
MTSSSTAFACDMNALTPAERERHGRNTELLLQSLQRVDEEVNGYSLRFANETQTIVRIAEFISLEKLCCPFFDFTLQVKSEDQSVILELTGTEGIKDFIRAEFGGAIQ